MLRRFNPLFLLLLLPAACGREKGLVLARVDRNAITADELLREMESAPSGADYLHTPAGKRELLELLIRRRVVLAEAEKSPAASRPETQKKLNELEAEFQRQRQEARDRLLVGEFLRDLKTGPLKVTDQDVKIAWASEREAKASHILVSKEDEARDLKARVDKGESFESLAKKYSEDPTGKNGGDLGWLMRGSLEPAFEDALFALKAGETAGPVASPYGFHIIKRTGDRPLSQRPLPELDGRIRTMLANQKFQAWLAGAKKRHEVTVIAHALETAGAAPSIPKK